jgi:glycine cleavage system H lipoate-binding protein/ABC-type phosphate transport system substrate-binding protein
MLMKNLVVSLVGLLLIYLLVLSTIVSCNRELTQTKHHKEDVQQERTVHIYSTPELSGLASIWSREYALLNPEARIKVRNVTESALDGKFENTRNLVFTSGKLDALMANSNWQEVIGRDALIPVLNSNNPGINEILNQGIVVEMLAQIVQNPEKRDWKVVSKTDQSMPINVYMSSDAATDSRFMKFLGFDPSGMEGIVVKGEKDLMAAIENDPYAMGICKLRNVIDDNRNSIRENLKVLPLDKNGNGHIDHFENIYDNLEALLHGVWIGKYPRALTNNIYAVSPEKPANETEVEFLKWVLTDGQQYLKQYGYSGLWNTERLAKVTLLDDYEIDLAPINNYSLSKKALFYYVYIPIIFVLSFAVAVMILRGIRYFKNVPLHIVDASSEPQFIFNPEFIKNPPGVYYDKSHTWAFMEKDGVVTIGIDDFLQHATGPLTGVKMKYPGERIKRGKRIVSIIQAGKQLDIYAPFSGIIRERNAELDINASMINSSPYDDGWIYKVEPTNWLKEIQFLFTGGKYKEWLKGEFTRLKEFFENSLQSEKVEYAPVLQDGGELKDGILSDCGPEVWEEFQTSFIDIS